MYLESESRRCHKSCARSKVLQQQDIFYKCDSLGKKDVHSAADEGRAEKAELYRTGCSGLAAGYV